MKRALILIFCLLLTGCSPRNTPSHAVETPFEGTVFTSAEEVWAADAEETYPDAPGELAETYDNLSALTEAAETVVYVTVTSVRNAKEFLVPDVLTDVSILEVWKENQSSRLREGSTITIRESGGANNTVQGNLPRMEPTQNYVLFLRSDGDVYRICGAIQGRFIERNGYLFQQTWNSLKIPETPARTENLENAVYRLQPHPADDRLGPPWIMSFLNADALTRFIDAAETQETCEQWIEENGEIHSWWLSDFEEASAISEVLQKLPFPTFVEEMNLNVDVYPDYGRDYVEIVHQNGEKIYRITIPMKAKTVEAGKYGRPVEAENFQALFDQTDVLSEQSTNRYYVGQVGDYPISFSLRGYHPEEALQFLRSLQFATLSDNP